MAQPVAASVLGAECSVGPGDLDGLPAEAGAAAEATTADAARAHAHGHPLAMALRSEVRAIEYRAKARDASGRAGVSVLDRVRERHAQAAAMWTQLADSEDRRTLTLRRRVGRAVPA